MASYQKLSNGKWRAQYYVNGKRYSVTCDTKRECQKAVERKTTYKGCALTVGEMISRYIEDRANILSPYTITGYHSIQRNCFLTLQKCRVDDLTERMVVQAVNEESAVKSPKTVRNALALIRSALREVVDVSSWDIPLPQKQRFEVRIPTDEELQDILKRFAGTELELPIKLAAFCGLRRSEICALTYGDFHDGYVWINKAVAESEDGTITIKPPKTDAGYRKVELPDCISVNGNKKERITTLTPLRLSTLFNHRTENTCSFHGLRHYYCSKASLLMPSKYVMQRMGHSTESMTKRVYQHIVEKADAEYGEALKTQFGKF